MGVSTVGKKEVSGRQQGIDSWTCLSEDIYTYFVRGDGSATWVGSKALVNLNPAQEFTSKAHHCLPKIFL